MDLGFEYFSTSNFYHETVELRVLTCAVLGDWKESIIYKRECVF